MENKLIITSDDAYDLGIRRAYGVPLISEEEQRQRDFKDGWAQYRADIITHRSHSKKMAATKHSKHMNHECYIDWTMLDSNGSPALLCSQCTTQRGKRKGKPAFVDWVSRRDIPALREINILEVRRNV